MKIVFFGTPSFASTILSFLIKNGIEVVAVVTKPDRPRGRSKKLVFSEVKQNVLDNHAHLPLFQPEKASDPTFAEKLRSFEADLFVVVAYGEIIKENLLKMPKLGCVNVHASLLPQYRGAAPIQFSLLNGDKETGVTVIEMVQKMDAGSILKQKTVLIEPEMDRLMLENKLCKAGCTALLEVIQEFQKGTIKKNVQDEDKASYVKKIDPSMAQIDWSQSADTIHNLVRAFSPTPGAWSFVKIGNETKRLKIFHTLVRSDKKGHVKEMIQFDKHGWLVGCGSGALELLEVQLEGKKRVSVKDFLQGCMDHPLFC